MKNKKLFKLKEQDEDLILYQISSSSENTRHNWSNDPDRYSDNDKDTKIEPKFEKKEPQKGKAKTRVSFKQRRIEHIQSNS